MRFLSTAALAALALFGASSTLAAPSSGENEKLTPQQKADRVKGLFQQSFEDYKHYAYGFDLLKPESKKGENDGILAGWGGTIVDSLTTQIIMKLDDQVKGGLDWIRNLDFSRTTSREKVNVFELTIRYIGGLVSAYELLEEKDEYRFLIDKARDLADRLAFAWTGENRIPYNSFDYNTLTPVKQNTGIAVAGTLALEWCALTRASGNTTYCDLGLGALQAVIDTNPAPAGLYAQGISPSTGKATDNYVTWGGGSDSAFEYLLKYGQMVGGNKRTQYVDAWRESVYSSVQYLIKYSSVGDRTYLTDRSGDQNIEVFSHLACFVGGNWIQGGRMLNDDTIVDYGLQLAETCYNSYQGTATGIGPESFGFIDRDDPEKDAKLAELSQEDRDFYLANGFYILGSGYMLRPEVLESVFYAWRATGNEKYRDWAWEAFLNLEVYTKAPAAYSGIEDVNQVPVTLTDNSQSFWYAETLKYLYLTFVDPSVMNLDSIVFNTEAHPLKLNNPNGGEWSPIQASFPAAS